MDITAKQRKIIKEKIKGKTNKQIGEIVYPNAKPESARVQVSGQLNKGHVAKYYEQSKLQALKEHNITWSRVIRPISDALEAVKSDLTGDVHIDHNTRLRASKQAVELLQVKEVSPEDKDPLLAKLPANVSEIQLVKIFKDR